MKSNSRTLRLAAAISLFIPAWACAQLQGFETGGYFRVGPGNTKPSASRACYGLDGPGLKYRLGNECDYYGEFLFATKFKARNVDYSINVMPNLYNGGTDSSSARYASPSDFGSASVGMAQMYVEGKGFDIAPSVSFWAGKRFYGRQDVHIVDTHYIDMSGVGAGAYNIAAGPGKLGLAYFGRDGGNVANPEFIDHDNNPLTPAVRPPVRYGTRLHVDYSDLPVNTNGTLRILGTFAKADGNDGQPRRNGFGFSAVHKQSKMFGSDAINQLWLQYAQGSAGLNQNFGPGTATSDVKSWRLIDSIEWQAGNFGGQAQAMFQTDKDAARRKTDSATIGGRISYAITENFKLLGELGHSQKKPEGGETQKLTKFTFAPTLSTGPGFWNRPELRVYVTTAKWNKAANAAAGLRGVTGLGDNATSGTSYGAQVEVWW